MATRAQRARLGAFMILATVLFVGAVGTLAGLRFWNPRDRYFVRYRESVSGLEVGSTVKMKGVRVGQVEALSMENVESVRVVLALAPTTPIKIDTRAVITSIGITGLKFIELTGGSREGERLPPNTARSEIAPGASIVHTLTGRAIDISQKAEQVLNNLLLLTDDSTRQRIHGLIDHSAELATSLNELVRDERALRIMKNAERATAALARAATSMDRVVQQIAPGLEDTLRSASAAAATFNRVAEKLRVQRLLGELTRAARTLRERIEDPALSTLLDTFGSTANTVRNVTRDFSAAVNHNDRQLRRLWSMLTNAADDLKSFARAIKERPSLLLRGETVKERDL